MHQDPNDDQLKLRAGKLIPITTIVLCLPLVAVGLLIAVTGELMGLLMAGFLGLLVVFFIIYLLPGAAFLSLSAEHFTVRHMFRRWSVPWLMVDRFFVVNLNKLPTAINPIKIKRVGYNLVRSSGLPGEVSIVLSGCEGMLPDNYGKKAEVLAELMNTWLQRAKSKAAYSSPELATEYESEIVVCNQAARGVGHDWVKEIDITAHSFALRLLRPADYALVFICGLWLFRTLIDILAGGRSSFFVAGFLFLCVYVGWRQRASIAPRMWKIQLLICPFLFLWSIFVLVVNAGDADNWKKSEVTDTFFAVLNIVWVAGSALGAMIAIMLLSMIRIPEIRLRIPKLVKSLRKAVDGRKITKVVSRANKRRAIVLALLGLAVILGVSSLPLPDATGSGRYLLQLYQFVGLFGVLLLILAQRYLQAPAAALLAADKRPPVLFLRSFADDEIPELRSLENSFLDFSLETRLTKHFSLFGPFIAVASPRDTVAQLGAARAALANSQWQSNVVDWISQANAIVLYAGKSRWVNWELAKIIDANAIARLILLIPELKGARRKRFEETAQRVNHVKQVFQGTLWSSSLDRLTDLVDVRAITFSADGSIAVIKSNIRNRDSYHLAALVAHYLNLSAAPVNRGPIDLGNGSCGQFSSGAS